MRHGTFPSLRASHRTGGRVAPFGLLLLALLLLVGSPAPGVAAGSGGGGGDYSGGSGGSSQRSSRSPKAVADRHYAAGLRHKQKAWKLEEKAAKAEDAKGREKQLAKARKAYEKAIRSQEAALKALPAHYEAENELGYALRKTGRFAEAIAAYDRALALNDVFYPAVEYRAEAYLATGQLDRAKSAYMTLFRNDRALAAQLMTAMDEWLAAQPEGEARASFAAWLEERKALAAIGYDLSQRNEGRWAP